MAVYKVPQDVEAEDKLLGPLSFRQFIYLVIAILSGGVAYFLGTIFIGLAIIPLPVVIIFLILALPLRKDQPMEVYAAAILAFYLKPRRKLWDPDGILTMVEFTNEAPQDGNNQADISFEEAKQQISFLSNLVDSNGQIAVPNSANPSLQSDVIAEARQIEDIHDENADINQRFDTMINRHNQEVREHIIENLNQQPSITQQNQTLDQSHQDFFIPPPPPPIQTFHSAERQFSQELESEQYANKQSYQVQQDTQISKPNNHYEINSAIDISQNSYDFQASPDIINLANNSDLSVQTIATEAKKIADRKKKLLGDEDEVIISLR